MTERLNRQSERRFALKVDGIEIAKMTTLSLLFRLIETSIEDGTNYIVTIEKVNEI